MPFLKKNPFEASMLVDNPDVKVVEGRFSGKPFFFAVGTSEQREVKGSGEVVLPIGAKGEYASQKSLKWNVLYNPKALPDFVPIDTVKDLMAGTVSLSGGTAVSVSALNLKQTGQEELKRIYDQLNEIKITKKDLEAMGLGVPDAPRKGKERKST